MHAKHLLWMGAIFVPIATASVLLRDQVGGHVVRAGPEVISQPVAESCEVRHAEPWGSECGERDALVAAVDRIQYALGEAKDVLSIVRAVAQAQNLVAAVPTLVVLADALEPSLHGVDDKDTACMKAQAAVEVLTQRLQAIDDRPTVERLRTR